MKKLAFFCLLLTGCASTPGTEYIIEGTEYSVSINWANSPRWSSGVLLEAEKHCVKYGRHAQFAAQLSDVVWSYNCVR